MDDIPATKQQTLCDWLERTKPQLSFPCLWLSIGLLANATCYGFVSDSGGGCKHSKLILLFRLISVLRRGGNDPQKTYQVLFAIWLLTFQSTIAAQLNEWVITFHLPPLLLIPLFKSRKYDVISTLMEIAKSAVKEKVVRITMAIFKVGGTQRGMVISLMLTIESHWTGTEK